MKQQRYVFSNDLTKENLNKPKLGQIEKNNENNELMDKSEIGELKSRMKALMNKLQTCKKEKEQYQKENQQLQQEIIQMQTNLRSMLPGFSNTSSNFPMLNELLNQSAEFCKCECFDIFFDLLCPELSLKGVIYFFKASTEKIQKIIIEYFQPTFQSIKQAGMFESLDGPIMNVLRKSFQQTYKQIEEKISVKIPQIKDEIQKNLKLEDNQNLLTAFLEKLLGLMLCCYINDPCLSLDLPQVGQMVYFNQAKHDPIDGFIKNKEECIVLIPQIYKNESEQLAKALVISSSYEFN